MQDTNVTKCEKSSINLRIILLSNYECIGDYLNPKTHAALIAERTVKTYFIFLDYYSHTKTSAEHCNI